MNHARTIASMFCMLLFGLIPAAGSLYAQCDPLAPPQGQLCAYAFSQPQAILIDEYGNPMPGEVSGEIFLRAVRNSSTPCQALLDIDRIEIDISTEGFGMVKVELDYNVPASLQVTANEISRPLPANASFSFNLVATLQGRPGETYRTTSVVTSTNPRVITFPFVHERFTLPGRIRFVCDQNPRQFFYIDFHPLDMTLRCQ